MPLSKRQSLTQYLIEQRRRFPQASGELNALILDVTLACKAIARAVAFGELGDMFAYFDVSGGQTNVQGEEQKKLDVIANEMFVRTSEWSGHLAGMASEEMEQPYQIPAQYPRGKYLLVFDPLDGSSNRRVAVRAPGASRCWDSRRRICISASASYSVRATKSNASSAITANRRAKPAITRCSLNAACSATEYYCSRIFVMSEKHPIIAITGSSGAGTTSVTRTFQQIFRREAVEAVIIEGDSFHRYDREEMKLRQAEAERAGDAHFSHFGQETNLFVDLERLFDSYGQNGTGQRRHYLHDQDEAAHFNQPPGTFTPWENIPEKTDLLFYEGLHGALVTADVNIARHPDLLIGVVPVINLEWIQKLLRDKSKRGYSTEAVTDTILRRMPDYVHYICPQFAHTHVNFQRVPCVDTSNPFIASDIPALDESFVVIRFANPKGIDFQYLLNMIDDSFMSRANTIVVPGGKMELAMQLIFTPFIWRMLERRKRALGAL